MYSVLKKEATKNELHSCLPTYFKDCSVYQVMMSD